MRDLTDRVLDTVAHLGATYADVRVVRRRDESIAVKSGRLEGVAMLVTLVQIARRFGGEV